MISTAPVLHAKPAFGIFPSNRAVDAGNHAGAAFEAAGKFDVHLSLLGQAIEICGAGIDTESFLAGVADLWVKKDVGLFIILKGIESQLFGNFHQPSPKSS